MSEPREMSPLDDPTNVDFRIVDDQSDDEGEAGMSEEEAEAFLARPVEPQPDTSPEG